jgi:hypothetical protein
MGQIAQLMGLQFENNGVNSQLSNSYLYGSPRDMYNKIRRHADIYATIDRGTLAIWPKFQNRTSAGSAITISPTDGTLIGYPAFTANGMMFTGLYNSGFAIGKQVTVQDSQITQANATWNVYNVNHNLESQTVSGKWESVLFATSPKFPTPIASTWWSIPVIHSKIRKTARTIGWQDSFRSINLLLISGLSFRSR